MSTKEGPTLTRSLVGAWRLESTLQRLTDGTVRPSPLYGPNGVGYLIYSASGQMCAMLANPSRERWLSEDEPTEKDLRAIYDSFVAYCGQYEVDEAQGIVTHHIELHVTPNHGGTLAVRHVSVEGSQLTLRPLKEELSPNMLEYTLTWRRIEEAQASPPP
jgi:Lipocalin-like domain